MGRLSTHILDTARGKPAVNVLITLHKLSADGNWLQIGTAKTNADGRTDQPLLSGETFAIGTYMLNFHIGDYFKHLGDAEPGFLDIIPVRFTMTAADGHYHVPLLATPWSYSTYRGS